MIQCLLGGNKVIACGISRSYANAQFLVSNLLNRYDIERPSFPSVLLSLESAVGSSLVFDQRAELLYQHQFNAVAQAVGKEIGVIALTGSNNDAIQGLLAEEDLEISIPTNKETRILENHLFVINAICELIDQTLFPRA